jgi:hypothetical protein
MKTRNIVLLALGATLAMALGIGAFVWFIWELTGEPVKVVRAQLDAIHRDDLDAAYKLLSPGTRASLSPEEFRAWVAKNVAVLKTRDATFLSRHVSNNTATVSGTLTGQSGDIVSVKVTLVFQDDRWQIESFRLREGPDD